MRNAPFWLTKLEARTRKHDGTEKAMVYLDPNYVVALCYLIREMGDTIGNSSLSCLRCPPGEVCAKCQSYTKAWSAYQRGPSGEGEKS